MQPTNLIFHGLAIRAKINCPVPFQYDHPVWQNFKPLCNEYVFYNICDFKDYHMVATNIIN
jgi:hypothetical protein